MSYQSINPSTARHLRPLTRWCHESDFGLGGSVFTKDAELPFGGVKNSGYGRELGDLDIQQFVNEKHVRSAVMDAPV